MFDTAGLVTIAVTQSRPWVEKRRVTDELVRAAMAHQPLAGEVYEDWPRALGGDPAVLRGYRLRRGSADAPVAFLAIDRKAPARGQVLQRYRQFAAKFPQAYHLHTLYGEAVGAVVERRLRIVSEGL